MVALSVSISAMMSPALTGSPSFFSHLARLPFSMVGESAGIRMLIGMAGSQCAAVMVPGSWSEFISAWKLARIFARTSSSLSPASVA